MIDTNAPLILGSGSPRRREILKLLKIPIRVLPGDAEEGVRSGERPSDYLQRIVRQKLLSVAERLDDNSRGGVLVADTIVLVADEVLGKPADDADACRMLRQLSGKRHEVWTRFAIAKGHAPRESAFEQTVRTAVYFRELSEDEVKRYVTTGEGRDKAGSYAVQGIGSFAVVRI
ncbi:MAG: septum formation protein Maf, partial [Sorangium cellulosum]